MHTRSILTVLLILTAAVQSLANEPPKDSVAPQVPTREKAAAMKPHVLKAKEFEPDEFGNGPFCKGIVIAARERRYFLKQQEIKAMSALLQKDIKALEDRLVEFKLWVQRREEFAKRASANLVEIYATMQPEASAMRLAELESELAASLLLAIAPRQASAILNEMDQKTAASLTAIMAASARKKDPS